MIRTAVMAMLSTMMLGSAAAQNAERQAMEACRDLDRECRQAVAVIGSEGRCDCDIFLLRREDDTAANSWRCEAAFRGTVGRNGLIDASLKREGDGCTPCGTYALRRGLWREADIETRFAMELYDDGCVWVDDPSSADYNTLVRGVGTEAAVRGERLAEVGTTYDYIVVVEYNTQPVEAGAGSAIFLHVWRAEGRPTAGCVAMPRAQMQRLVGWLSPQEKPAIVITKGR